MDIPRDKNNATVDEYNMTVQEYHTEILKEQNKSIGILVNSCLNLSDRAKVNLTEHDRLEKRIKSLESFVLGLFIGNIMTGIILITFLVTL